MRGMECCFFPRRKEAKVACCVCHKCMLACDVRVRIVLFDKDFPCCTLECWRAWLAEYDDEDASQDRDANRDFT